MGSVFMAGSPPLLRGDARSGTWIDVRGPASKKSYCRQKGFPDVDRHLWKFPTFAETATPVYAVSFASRPANNFLR